MKTLGVQITAFNEERFIQPVMKQFEDLVDEIVVAVSEKPWYGDIDPDNTYFLACRVVPEAVVISGTWKNEAEQRNFCMDKLQDCDYVLVCHADTFFKRSDIKKIIDFIQTATERQYDIPSLMYWKDFDTTIFPDPIIPAMLIRKDVRFKHNIIIEDQVVDAPQVPVTCHHLSWAKTNEEVKTKLATYGHATEIIPDWYEKVWLGDQKTSLSPTNPSDYEFTKHGKLPKEIRSYFETA